MTDVKALSLNGWADLPVELVTQALRSLSGGSWASLRLVCRQWRDLVDSMLRSLTPTALFTAWARRLPSLRTLSLERLAAGGPLLSLSAFTSLSTLVVPGWAIDNRTCLCHLQCRPVTAKAQGAPWASLLSLTLLGSQKVDVSLQQLLSAPLQRICLQKCSFAAVQRLLLPDSLTSMQLEDCIYLTHEHIEWLVQPQLTQLVLRWNRGLEVEPTLAVLGAQAEQLRHLTFTPAGDIRPSFPAGTGLSNAWNCFSGMLQLTCLSLCGHKYLGNAGVQRLTQLSQLQGLDLSMTSVTSNGLAGLSQLQNLRSLQLSSCLLTMPSALKAVLLSFPHLTCLDLSETRVVLQNRQLQSLLVHMKILHSLNLSYLSTAMDDDLASLTELQQLHTLILAHSDVYLFAMMWITALTNLTSLDVQGAGEMGAGELANIASLTRLQSLNIADRSVPCLPEEYSTLARLSVLTHLSLSIQHLGYGPSEAVYSIKEEYKRQVQRKLAPLGHLPLMVFRIWNGPCTLHPRNQDHWQDRPSITAESVADRLPVHLLRAVINGRLLHDLDGAAYVPV